MRAVMPNGTPSAMLTSTSEGASLLLGGSVATILIDQKHRYNALGLRTWLVLPELVAAAEQHAETGVIVLRGAHANFGSGNDISEFGALHGDPAGAKAFGKAMADAMMAVETASKPVIVAVEGFCYGGSVALALAGDLRVAAANAKFAITPAKLGALYLQSDLHRLVSAVGLGRAKSLIYSAQPIDAARAQDIGLIDEVISADDFDTELERVTDVILRGSPFTLRRTKEMLRSVGNAATPAETDETLALFVEATQSDDFKEGIGAFLTKRLPRFR